MGGGCAILMLEISGYIWQWAERAIENPIGRCGIIRNARVTRCRNVSLSEIRCTSLLIKQHIDALRMAAYDGNNSNTLGLARNTVPQINNKGEVKGSTLTFISIDGEISTL